MTNLKLCPICAKAHHVLSTLLDDDQLTAYHLGSLIRIAPHDQLVALREWLDHLMTDGETKQ